VVATFSAPLALGLLVAALAMRAVVRRQWMKIIDKLDAETAGQRYEYYVSSQAVYHAAKDVRLFGLGDWFAGRFRAAAVRTYGPVWREMLGVLRRQWPIVGGSLLAGAVVLAAPAWAVLDGRLAPGRLITCVLAGFGVLAISSMGMEAYDIEYGLRGVADADALVRTYGKEQARPTTEPQPSAPEVSFDNVVFSYPGARRPVLDGLTLRIAAGQVVAIVGENGAGKTTFVKLLAGLYRPDSGTITVGGGSAITALFQDFVKYPASLRENVTGGLDGDDAAVLSALDRAGAADLPAGLDTLLWREGADGTDLSGGQWQRVALARALHAVAAGRRLLVLDEPTANLDVRAEASFYDQVVAQVRDTTTILISHRLSTVRSADRIIVLHDGRVAEDGTHDELMALGGQYARFFTTQAEAFR